MKSCLRETVLVLATSLPTVSLSHLFSPNNGFYSNCHFAYCLHYTLLYFMSRLIFVATSFSFRYIRITAEGQTLRSSHNLPFSLSFVCFAVSSAVALTTPRARDEYLPRGGRRWPGDISPRHLYVSHKVLALTRISCSHHLRSSNLSSINT